MTFYDFFGLSFDELIEFFDDYCLKLGIACTDEAGRVWLAMFYCWKEKGVWVRDESVSVESFPFD